MYENAWINILADSITKLSLSRTISSLQLGKPIFGYTLPTLLNWFKPFFRNAGNSFLSINSCIDVMEFQISVRYLLSCSSYLANFGLYCLFQLTILLIGQPYSLFNQINALIRFVAIFRFLFSYVFITAMATAEASQISSNSLSIILYSQLYRLVLLS